MGRRDVIKGALLLTLSSLLSRSVDFIFRVYYSNRLGPEGMGIFQLIGSAHGIMLTVAYGGLTVAVSRLTSENLALGREGEVRRVVRTAIIIALVSGLAAAIAVMAGAHTIGAGLLREVRTVPGLRYIAPSVIMMGVSACIKGYFYASRKVLRPASSEFLEQFVKITGISALLDMWLPKGLEYGCAAVALGITIGEISSCSYLIILYLLDMKGLSLRGRGAGRPVFDILSISLPGAASSFIGSALRMAESVLIISGMRAWGLTAGGAVSVYGMVSGIVMPLLVFPLSMLSSVVTTMIPEVSRIRSMNATASIGGALGRALRFASMFGFMIMGMFMLLGNELGSALYSSSEAGAVIKILCVICPFACMEMIAGAILHGMGEQMRLLKYNVLDSALRISLIFVLIPRMGYTGLLTMIVLSNLFTFVLVLRRMAKITGASVDFSGWLLRPLSGALYAILITRPVLLSLPANMPLGSKPVLACCVLLFCLVYMGVNFILKSVTAQDVRWLTS